MRRHRLGLLSLGLILLAAASGCGLAAGAQDGEAAQARGATTARVEPTPEPTPPPLRAEDLLGSDGRLTVLVLGSDEREGVIGTRTDAIIAVTLNPTSGRVAMVSLPRDTVGVPIGPGETYPDRINGLYWAYERELGKAKPALKRLKSDLAYAFGTELDYYAMVDFDGLVRLINSIGGIELTLAEAIIDPTMHIGKSGLRLKAGKRQLDGRKALAFSRSRHSDSDYDRSRRQHDVLVAAATKVRKRGAERLPGLVGVASKRIVTDLPERGAPVLLELAAGADLGKVKSVVLEPARFARQLSGSYTIVPRMPEVQKVFERLFKPVG
jgi:LCP family protein required for cell wall assembly